MSNEGPLRGRMPGKLEKRVLELIEEVTGGNIDRKAQLEWLKKPGEKECGDRWELVCKIYLELTGKDLSKEMQTDEWKKKKQNRRVDGVLSLDGFNLRVVEVDELQHFNKFRGRTLKCYPMSMPLAFDRTTWSAHSTGEPRPKTGNWAKPCPPLFPDLAGRHLERAFRDALTDLLPLDRGFVPTLRIAHFEVEEWISTEDAGRRMEALLKEKIGTWTMTASSEIPEPTKMWSGRFREPLNQTFESWQRSFPFDYRLLPQEVAASKGHARAIAAAGILTDDELATMLKAWTRSWPRPPSPPKSSPKPPKPRTSTTSPSSNSPNSSAT